MYTSKTLLPFVKSSSLKLPNVILLNILFCEEITEFSLIKQNEGSERRRILLDNQIVKITIFYSNKTELFLFLTNMYLP